MDLVADIGGTNSRLALAENGQPVAGTVQSFRNAGHETFWGILETYLDKMSPKSLRAVCIAIAGPVQGAHGTLTNRDWTLDCATMARITGARQAVLLNDLAALGYSVPHLTRDQTRLLRPAADGARRNGQAFVFGLGTGVNLAVSMETAPAQFSVLEAEAGHVALPAGVNADLVAALGEDAAARFFSVEELFAGRGLAGLFSALSGGTKAEAQEVLMKSEAAASAAVELYARLLGRMLRELILQYLPLDGVYFSGSVARGVLEAAPAPFLQALHGPHLMEHIIDAPSISVIMDDAAALTGCAARLANEA